MRKSTSYLSVILISLCFLLFNFDCGMLKFRDANIILLVYSACEFNSGVCTNRKQIINRAETDNKLEICSGIALHASKSVTRKKYYHTTCGKQNEMTFHFCDHKLVADRLW